LTSMIMGGSVVEESFIAPECDPIIHSYRTNAIDNINSKSGHHGMSLELFSSTFRGASEIWLDFDWKPTTVKIQTFSKATKNSIFQNKFHLESIKYIQILDSINNFPVDFEDFIEIS